MGDVAQYTDLPIYHKPFLALGAKCRYPAGMSDQANRIIGHFGGPLRVAQLLDISPSTVYRWRYSQERGGTGGVIPHQSAAALREIADLYGIAIPAADWAP